MPRTIHQRLTLGSLFLYALLLVSIVLGLMYLLRVDDEGKAVLADNYESVRHLLGMHAELDRAGADRAGAIAGMDSLLKAQEANITEPGEREQTQTLAHHFAAWRAGDSTAVAGLRSTVDALMALNLDAIARKSHVARENARRALFWLFLSALMLILVGLAFSVAFPSLMSAPIVRLKEAAQQVAAHNYSHRIPPFHMKELDELATAFNHMAAELEAYDHSNLARLMAEKNRAEAVINALQDASIGVGPDGTVLFANHQALELLGLHERDLVGRTAEQLKLRSSLLQRILSGPGTLALDGADGRLAHYLVSVLPVRGGQGPLGLLYVARNITTFHERDQARTNFLATISHELKTPLASSDIGLTLLERMANGTPALDQRAILTDLRKDHQRLSRIVGELLDMAQAETGQIRLHVAPSSATDVVRAALDAVHTSAQAKQLHMEDECGTVLPPILVDADKAVWVLVNVLANAVRHSPVGGIISVSAHVQEGCLEVWVTDQGPGVAANEREHIFQRFIGQAAGGTGLGLSIAREFMQAMGGTIALDPTVTTGAAFVLRFPLAP